MSAADQAGQEPFGLRLLNLACAGLVGFLIGMLGTFGHRLRFEAFGAEIWIGWVLAIALVLAVGVLGRGGWRRSERFAYAIGVPLGVLVFAGPGIGHSVLVPAAEGGFGVGELWTYGSLIAAFLPVLWPQLRHARRPGEYPGR